MALSGADRDITALPPGRQRDLLLRLEIDEFNTRYAAIVDRGDLQEWPNLFAENAIYRIISRENFDAGLPVGLVYCDSQGMLEDRVNAILKTMVYSPRAILHFITNVELLGIAQDATISAQANFLLVENLVDRNARLLMAGQYSDKLVRRQGQLLIKERHCIYDSTTIQTSVVYPV
jgi:3-phenylpropionate/cinnamic acid dioxygenase small subunit